MPEADVIRLFKAAANFISGSKQKQIGYDRTLKKIMLHDTDDSRKDWSEDSLQLLKAGAQDITGQKTFKVNQILETNKYLGPVDLCGLSFEADGEASITEDGESLGAGKINVGKINAPVGELELQTDDTVRLEIGVDVTSKMPLVTEKSRAIAASGREYFGAGAVNWANADASPKDINNLSIVFITPTMTGVFYSFDMDTTQKFMLVNLSPYTAYFGLAGGLTDDATIGANESCTVIYDIVNSKFRGAHIYS